MTPDSLQEGRKTLPHEIVIVMSLGIPGYAGGHTGGTVVHGYADHAACAGHQQAGVHAFGKMVLQVVHAGLTTLVEPTAVGRGHTGLHGSGGSHATKCKAKAVGLGFDVCANQTP